MVTHLVYKKEKDIWHDQTNELLYRENGLASIRHLLCISRCIKVLCPIHFGYKHVYYCVFYRINSLYISIQSHLINLSVIYWTINEDILTKCSLSSLNYFGIAIFFCT